jgi:hypothetical protein
VPTLVVSSAHAGVLLTRVSLLEVTHHEPVQRLLPAAPVATLPARLHAKG